MPLVATAGAPGSPFREAADGVVSLPELHPVILEAVIRFCIRYHDSNFTSVVFGVEPPLALELMNAAHYLGVGELERLVVALVSDNVDWVADLSDVNPDVLPKVLSRLKPAVLAEVEHRDDFVPSTMPTEALWEAHLRRVLEVHRGEDTAYFACESDMSDALLLSGGDAAHVAAEAICKAREEEYKEGGKGMEEEEECGKGDEAEDFYAGKAEEAADDDLRHRFSPRHRLLRARFFDIDMQNKANHLVKADRERFGEQLAEAGFLVRNHVLRSHAVAVLADETDSRPAWLQYVSLLPNVEQLDLSSIELDVHDLAAYLVSQPQLRFLGLNHMQLSNASFSVLLPAISRLPRLQRLLLAENKLGRRAMEALLAALPRMPKLQVLDLSANYIRTECISRAAHTALAASDLRVLRLSRNHLSELPPAEVFVSSAVRRTVGRPVRLPDGDRASEKHDDEADGEAASLFEHLPPSLVELHLATIRLSYEQLPRLIAGLRNTKRLAVLDVGFNEISYESLGQMAPVLVSLPLKRLLLAGNSLDRSAQLVEVLSGSPTLRVLDISRNRIGGCASQIVEGAKAAVVKASAEGHPFSLQEIIMIATTGHVVGVGMLGIPDLADGLFRVTVR
eukprot:PLAT1172.2.p1 GENE.PLAT1172.2~~PLAT1172.2.p1  ORF type:complete len:622 (-),score=294.44 PLAT1172.2:430-2295(-)